MNPESMRQVPAEAPSFAVAARGETATPAAAEAELLARLRAGDERAAEQLVREQGGRMMMVARRFFRSESDCDDALQDAFISAFRGVHSFEGGSSLSTWLHRITVNSCLMMIRSRSRRRTVPMGDLLPVFDDSGHRRNAGPRWGDRPDDAIQSAETRAQVRAAIDRLPDSYRTVILLRDIEDLDTAETAKLLGSTPGAVKVSLHRARQALRTLLEPAMVDG